MPVSSEIKMKRRTISNHCVILAGKMVLCLMLLLCHATGQAQEDLLKTEYSYKRYTTQDGLPNLTGITLHQDSRGFIWIGSMRGFSRFDGFDFTTFESEGLTNIYHIRSSPDGTVRAYSQRDVFIAGTNDSIRRVRLVADSLDFMHYCSRSLPEGYLLYESLKPGYRRHYLAHVENDSITELLHFPELHEMPKNGKPIMDNDKLYIADHTKNIVNVFDMHTLKKINTFNLNAHIFLKHSRLGLLAFGEAGVYAITGNTFTQIAAYTDENLAKYAIMNCIETENGSVFFVCYSSIYRFDNGKIEKQASLPGANYDLLYDKEGNYWVINSTGMYNFFQFDFQNYTIEKNRVVSSFVEDEKGDLWFSANEALYQYSLAGNETKRISYPDNYTVRGYACAAYGKIYFPLYSSEGVMIKDKDKFSIAETPADDYFSKAIALPEGEVLILSAHGLYRCTAAGKLIRTYDTGFLRQDEIFDVVIDKHGRWIVGGSLGVSIIDGDKVDLIASEHTPFTLMVDIDSQGNVWSVSEDRLNLIRNGNFVTVYRFNENIQSLKVLKTGYMAVTSVYGLYLMNIQHYLSSGLMRHLYYDRQNGMTGLYPDAFGINEDSKGMVWILTNSCVVRFDPERLIRQTSKPNLITRHFAVSKDNVAWENVDDFTNAKFSYTNKNFKFSFIGLNYSTAEHVRYHYRLCGFQDNWSEPTKQREVTFNNLPPGDYSFEIYADAGTDESRSETQSYNFSIKPAFWQTVWFMVACIAALMLTGAGAALYIQRRKDKTLLEKLRTEKELNELRISSIRLKAIPHFNANVLSAIEYYIANRTKEEAMFILGIYSDFTLKTLSEVSKASRPISEELAYVKMYLDLEKIRFMEKFDFQINMDDGVDESVQLPNMILHTYCENAVKHGLMPLKSGGLLTINVSQRDGVVFVSVEVNGVGRAYATLHPHQHSSQQGLAILNRQIEIYNNFNLEKITSQVEDLLKDEKPSGTRFTVGVPVGFSYID
jgi:sugar lactone lactonase YvrE